MTEKVHWIGSGGISAWQRTACGADGKATPVSGVYEGWKGRVIMARYRDWNGVTCKACLRNPHAPGGRYAPKCEATAPI